MLQNLIIMFVFNRIATHPHCSHFPSQFVHTCHEHCSANWDGAVLPAFNASFPNSYHRVAIGGTTMQQAVRKWWGSAEGAPAAEHKYMPCEWAPGTAVHQCNPTCGKD